MSQAIRVVSTRVLPDPAPAKMSAGRAGKVTAANCSGFRPRNKLCGAMPCETGAIGEGGAIGSGGAGGTSWAMALRSFSSNTGMRLSSGGSSASGCMVIRAF